MAFLSLAATPSVTCSHTFTCTQTLTLSSIPSSASPRRFPCLVFCSFRSGEEGGKLTLGRCPHDVSLRFPISLGQPGDNKMRKVDRGHPTPKQSKVRDGHEPEALSGSKSTGTISTTSPGEGPGTTGAGPGTFQAHRENQSRPSMDLWISGSFGCGRTRALLHVMISCDSPSPSGSHS